MYCRGGIFKLYETPVFLGVVGICFSVEILHFSSLELGAGKHGSMNQLFIACRNESALN